VYFAKGAFSFFNLCVFPRETLLSYACKNKYDLNSASWNIINVYDKQSIVTYLVLAVPVRFLRLAGFGN